MRAVRAAGRSLPLLIVGLPLAARGADRSGSPAPLPAASPAAASASMSVSAAGTPAAGTPAAGTGARIDLSTLDALALQAIMDALADPDCPTGDPRQCRWHVLSFERGPADTTGEADRPAPPAPGAPALRPDIDLGTPDPPRSGQRFSARVPEGFEALAARRRAEVEVRVDGMTRTRARISFDAGSFAFEDPAALAAELVADGIGERSRLERFLALDQPLAAEDVCIDEAGPHDCLTREPSSFAILPDIAARQVELVRRTEPSDVPEATRRLPPPASGASVQLGARATVAALEGSEAAADAALDGSVSYGAGGLFGAGSWGSTDEELRLNALYVAHQLPEHEARLGTLDHASGPFLRNRRLLGARWTRSLNTYPDSAALFGLPITVDLDSRSIVQLVVDGVVLHSETLDAGLRTLDTRALPDGSYEVEVRVRGGGEPRVERVFFTRTPVLPPPDVPLYGVSVGATLEPAERVAVPEPDGESLASAFVDARVSPATGLRFELTRGADTTLGQLRLTRIGRRFRLQLDGLVGGRSALGAALRAAWRGGRFGLSLQGLRFESDRDAGASPPRAEALARLLPPDTERFGLGASARLGRWTLDLRADRSRGDDEEGIEGRRERLAATLRRRLGRGAFGGGIVSAGLVEEDGERRVELRLDLFARDGDVEHRGVLALERRSGEPLDPRVGYRATWEPGSEDGYPDARRWIGSVETGASRSRSTLGATARYVDRHVDLGLGADASDERDEGRSSPRWRALATASTQLAASGTRLAGGRYSGQSSGIIVDVAGEPSGAPFDILVDGRRRAVGEVGSRQFVGLAPYRRHEVRLVPRTLAFNGFDETPSDVTLYPGNVQSVQLETESRYLLVTSLVDAERQLLRNAVLRHGEERYYILEDAIVQIEVRAFEPLDVDLGDGRSCRASAPDPAGEDIVVSAAPLLCL